MNWNQKLQIIIDDVENHLQRTEEPINPFDISEIAECSYSFFQKVFSYFNGISFADYIRFRKLTLAGYDLKSTDLKVIDISYKYGYDSPTSFTKAFKEFHGITPKEARHKNLELKVVPKMQILESQEYTWKIIKKQSVRLIGKELKLSKDSEFQKQIIDFWSDCQKNGLFQELAKKDQGIPNGMFGIFDENSYNIMVISNEELPKGWVEIYLKEESWAIFDCRGPVPASIQKCWKYLQEEWIIKYPFDHAKEKELEWYSNGNPFDSEYLSQIWIPILEKVDKK